MGRKFRGGCASIHEALSKATASCCRVSLLDRKRSARSVRTIALSFALLLDCLVAVATSAHASSLCGLSKQDLESEFLRAVGIDANDANRGATSLPLARWEKRSLGIGIYQDRSAALLKQPLERNLAIFKAIGLLGLSLQFGVDIGNGRSDPAAGRTHDIELIFVSEAMKFAVFFALPAGVMRSKDANSCPAYLELKEDRKGIRTIAKAHILVDAEMDVEAMPACIAAGLANAAGLLGWKPILGGGPEEVRLHQELYLFIDALYGAGNPPSIGDIIDKLESGRASLCPL